MDPKPTPLGLGDWRGIAPWEVRYGAATVESWALQVQTGSPWELPKTLCALPQTLVMWQMAYLATILEEPDALGAAAKWEEGYREFAQGSLETNAVIMPAAAWVGVRRQLPAEGGKQPVGDTWRARVAPEATTKPAFSDFEKRLREAAGRNRIPVGFPSIIRPNNITRSMLARDATLLWTCMLQGTVPAWNHPTLTLWCPDPVIAAACRHEHENGGVSVFGSSKAPYNCTLTLGWMPPSTLLSSAADEYLTVCLRGNFA